VAAAAVRHATAKGAGRAMVCALLVLLAVGCGPLGQAEAGAAEELLALFPAEIGFTGRYEDFTGKGFALTLAAVDRPAGTDATVFDFAGRRAGGERFRLQYRVDGDGVQEYCPAGLPVPPEVNPLTVLRAPLEEGRSWTQRTGARVVTATVLAAGVDPGDGLRTVRVGYAVADGDSGRLLYTEERTFKQGLGLARMELRPGGGVSPLVCALTGTAPNYRYAGADGGKIFLVDAGSLRLFVEPDGTEIAEVRLLCMVDAAGRTGIIAARAGTEEPVAGFERLAYFKRLVWFRIPRDKSREPVRMIGASEYYDAYGTMFYAEDRRDTWRGGKWFTIPGYEQVFAAALLLKSGRAAGGLR